MSTKSTKQSKKLSVPREMATIQAEYQQQCASAGQLQYQIKVFSKDLERINERLLAINNEAASRQQLDREAAAKETAAKETKEDTTRTAGLSQVETLQQSQAV